MSRNNFSFREHCGKRWQKIGWLLLLSTILVQLPYYGKDDTIVGNVSLIICIVECAIIVFSIPPTEKALQKEFDADGNRITPKTDD